MIDEQLALQALKEANFDSTTNIKSVWRDSKYDVGSLHEKERQRIINELERLKASEDFTSPIGIVFVGAGGTGKTHLLSAIRKYAFSQNIGFVLADMTAVVNSFWDTVLQGYVNSLQEGGIDGTPQFKRIIESLIDLTDSPTSVEQLAKAPAQTLNKEIQAILAVLAIKERQRTVRFRDVIRAILLLNSDDIAIRGTADD
jgi:hypothetical protein